MYRCTSNMTQSLKACCTVVQVYVACLRVLCGTRLPDEQTRVGSCSRCLTPVEARPPSECTCRSVNFFLGPTAAQREVDMALMVVFSSGIHDCGLIVTRLYRCASSTTRSLKACYKIVQVYANHNPFSENWTFRCSLSLQR